MVKKIALEEHFLDPATEPYWRPTMVDVAPPKTAQLYASLTDFGEQRLQMMDKTGIARAVLAIAGPGRAGRARHRDRDPQRARVERFPRPGSAEAAGPLFRLCPSGDAGRRKPPPTSSNAACASSKFCGAMINGHTNGKYLDDRSYDPFWERAAALGAAIYLHPADPVAPPPVLAGYNVLARPMWGWGVETGSHALRIICGGVFHRYPKAKLAARPSRRDAAVPALALRQPLEALRLEFAEAAVAIPQGERLGDDVGHVRSPAVALLARCARARPRHVLGRLSVRLGRGRAFHRHGAARGIPARGYRLQQCGEAAGTGLCSAVVPAKAGTHTPQLLGRSRRMGPGSRSPGSSPGSLGRDDSDNKITSAE